ncbi:O-glycoside alpha-1,2-mannosyltransferase omh1 [Smittium culicis]|uniref:O-glycoside alpha-1,2-mannosyltransferase omh1 n=1 Tax=Smittium culicis TaxID=133412 RepID=A0A1R1YB42_9FUNG|nr:O-glycoside alpha-1,2-mannosyltransferase omh1 [Smittium culicis]
MTKAPIYFGVIPKYMWEMPDFIDLNKFKENIDENKNMYVHGNSTSFRIMSRFFSKFIHKHPLLRNLEYYWRIQAGVDYLCEIDYDPFEMLKSKNIKYSWIITPQEYKLTIPTLWETAREYIFNNYDKLPESSFATYLLKASTNTSIKKQESIKFNSSKDGNIKDIVNESSKYSDVDIDYNLCHFWSNFEIVSLDFLKSKPYQDFVDHLDKAGGIFYERWGDAPIRSIIASTLLSKSSFHWFEDFGYMHTGNTHCPSNPALFKKCSGCKITDSVVYSSMCYKKYIKSKDISRNDLFKLLFPLKPDLQQ